MKSFVDPRHNARLLAIQKLFEVESNPTSDVSSLELVEMSQIESYDSDLYHTLLKGVNENKEQIDLLIRKYAEERPLDELIKTDLEILRIAVYEGFIGKITPPKVAIDEAIELSKIFSGINSAGFVNGVLDSILRNESK